MTESSHINPSLLLAKGFAIQVEHWAHEREIATEAARVVKEAAYLVSMATSAGHVCIDINALVEALGDNIKVERVQELLESCGLVGNSGNPGTMPLVIDNDGRIYLHRYFDYELRLARRLIQCMYAETEPVRPDLEARLKSLFEHNETHLGGRADWQKLAAAKALLGKLTIISGGPGTGKTTTVVSLLACLLEQNPDYRIALAAPTGKAAARMQEAIRQRAMYLPKEIQALLPQESFTIHRLLGVTPSVGIFRHHAGNRLAFDVFVVDEASMLDLALATQLFEAVPDSARIILLGDKDQLAAVESGAVFSELSANPFLTEACKTRLADMCGISAEQVCPQKVEGSQALADTVVWFTENFRFPADSGIGRLAACTNAGLPNEVLEVLKASPDGRVEWLQDGAWSPGESTYGRFISGYEHYLDALRAGTEPGAVDCARITASFGQFRILCAVRDGPRGVVGVNEAIARHFRQALADRFGTDERAEWFVGRPVMVLRNDYVLKLFNGDIGIVLPDAGGHLMVWFPDAADGFRAIAPARLPVHETAFAMTVHKSQGSEFSEVLVLLPSRHDRVLTRELLYTAVTRSANKVTVVGGADVIAQTVQSKIQRHSGLLARLDELKT